MNKTEKSMAELQIEINLAYEFDKITESGSALQQVSGPGYIGLTNLGNSCYMNSVLQILWALPEFGTRFVQHADSIYRSAPSDIAGDFLTQVRSNCINLERCTTDPISFDNIAVFHVLQFTKVGVALVEGRTAGDAPGVVTYDALTVSTEADGGLEAVAEQKETEDLRAVKPQMFKSVIGQGHPEFASSRQQVRLGCS